MILMLKHISDCTQLEISCQLKTKYNAATLLIDIAVLV